MQRRMVFALSPLAAPTKKEYYYYLEVPDFSILIPKFKNKFILVSQKRYAINKNTLEFPSGWVDKNEKPEMVNTMIGRIKEWKDEINGVR